MRLSELLAERWDRRTCPTAKHTWQNPWYQRPRLSPATPQCRNRILIPGWDMAVNSWCMFSATPYFFDPSLPGCKYACLEPVKRTPLSNGQMPIHRYISKLGSQKVLLLGSVCVCHMIYCTEEAQNFNDLNPFSLVYKFFRVCQPVPKT